MAKLCTEIKSTELIENIRDLKSEISYLSGYTLHRYQKRKPSEYILMAIKGLQREIHEKKAALNQMNDTLSTPVTRRHLEKSRSLIAKHTPLCIETAKATKCSDVFTSANGRAIFPDPYNHLLADKDSFYVQPTLHLKYNYPIRKLLYGKYRFIVTGISSMERVDQDITIWKCIGYKVDSRHVYERFSLHTGYLSIFTFPDGTSLQSFSPQKGMAIQKIRTQIKAYVKRMMKMKS